MFLLVYIAKECLLSKEIRFLLLRNSLFLIRWPTQMKRIKFGGPSFSNQICNSLVNCKSLHTNLLLNSFTLADKGMLFLESRGLELSSWESSLSLSLDDCGLSEMPPDCLKKVKKCVNIYIQTSSNTQQK